MHPQSERGAILIFVAIMVFVLSLLSIFVIDSGVFWLARGEAQTAADGGALAGAIGLELDDAGDLTSSGPAYVAATKTAGANTVMGGTASIHVDLSANSASWAHTPPASCASGGCVQVDVNTSTVPTYFAQMFGLTSQTMRATATAQVVTANAALCMRPWFILDKYTDSNGDNQYDAGDVYSAPGYRIPDDLGTAVIFHANTSPSGYGQIDVGSGGSAIQDAIEQCAGGTFRIGDVLQTKPGGTTGPEQHGVQSLLDWDPDNGGVHWDAPARQVVGGCAPHCTCPGNPGNTCPYGGVISPRIVQAAICSPTEASCAAGGPSNSTIVVTNILSFFITDYQSGDIHAVLINSAGDVVSGPSAPGGTGGSFLKSVQLIR